MVGCSRVACFAPASELVARGTQGTVTAFLPFFVAAPWGACCRSFCSHSQGSVSPWHAGDALSRDLVVRDTDGSLVGTKEGGYVVANFSFLLPHSQPRVRSPCTALPASNAFACRGLCYRTLFIEYSEPGFAPLPRDAGSDPASKRHGDFRYTTLYSILGARVLACEGFSAGPRGGKACSTAPL